MKRNFALMLALVLVCSLIAGCGKKEPEPLPEFTTVVTEAETVPTEPRESLPQVQPDPGADPSGYLRAFENFMAMVDSSTETGCVVIPDLKYIKDGQYCGGSREPDLCDETIQRVTIEYNPGCVFQLADVSVWTGNCTYKNATAADVQHNVHVVVFGEYDSDGILHADRVYVDTLIT